jgi:hypothetical protein
LDCLPNEECSGEVCVPGGSFDAGRFSDATAPDALEPKDAQAQDRDPPDSGASCSDLDEPRCLAEPSCTTFRCPACSGVRFVGCAPQGSPPPPCARPRCGCAMNLGELACNADPECHPVYSRVCEGEPQMPLCLMMFASCGEGPVADCNGAATCERAAPECTDGYVVSYADSCYEGCVQPGRCAR